MSRREFYILLFAATTSIVFFAAFVWLYLSGHRSVGWVAVAALIAVLVGASVVSVTSQYFIHRSFSRTQPKKVPERLPPSGSVDSNDGELMVVMWCIVLLPGLLYVLFIPRATDDSGDRWGASSSDSTRTIGSTSERKIDAWVMAQQVVRDRLKSPSSASFGSMFGDYQNPEQVVSDLGGGKYCVRAWVEAQNSFGATVRTQFVCDLERASTGSWRSTSLQMAE